MDELIKRLSDLEDRLEALRIYKRNITPKAIQQTHVDGIIIFEGLSADRPAGGAECKAYWATDTGVLSLWNGTAWLSETLT